MLLEPILGVALALNLAYIGLPRFRYRSKIAKAVQELMAACGWKEPSEELSNRKWYKAVARLARLDIYKGSFFSKSPSNDFKGAWVFWYEWIFMCHVDRSIAVVSSFLAITLMALGVIHSIPIYGWYEGLFTKEITYLIFWFVIFLCILPVLFVFLGKYVVDRAIADAKAEIEDLADEKQGNVTKASANKKV